MLIAMLSAFPAILNASAEDMDFGAYTTKNKQTTAYFATYSTLSLFDDFTRADKSDAYAAAWEDIKALMGEVERAVSVSMPDSDIARFNALPQGGSLRVSGRTAEILRIAGRIYEQSNGAFDPTVYPLVDLWGFTPRFNTNQYAPETPYDRAYEEGVLPRPDALYIEGLLPLVGFSGIELRGDEASGYMLIKHTADVSIDGVAYSAKLDLGGVAKGYVVDEALQILRDAGFAYGYFSNGGSSMGLLRNGAAEAAGEPDSAFRVGVRKPRAGLDDSLSAYAKIKVQSRCLSTSGDYDHCYRVGDTICCHIIDPFTGYPINWPDGEAQRGISTVTLFCDSAALGDAYTTALCVMPFEETLAFINEHLRDVLVAVVLYSADSEIYEVVTNIPEGVIEIQDSAYQMASRIDADGTVVYTGTLLR